MTLALLMLATPVTVVHAANAWGEAVEGAQLGLALETPGRPTLPGDLPPLVMQIRNQGANAITVNPEALMFADVEIDGVWYSQRFIVSAAYRARDMKPGSLGGYPVTIRVRLMLEMNGPPSRGFKFSSGPHRIRLRSATGNFNVRTANGKELVLISNVIDMTFPPTSGAEQQVSNPEGLP